MWVMAEEAMIIATFLLQKATRNSLESGFKPVVWPLVVDAVRQATSEAIKKNLQQCKTCYHRVCVQFSLVCKQLLITSRSRLSEYKTMWTLHVLSGFGWDEGEQM